ncbi:MAG: phytoene/squalene synthase family protein [Candidatus Omnitrophica bacterium]|nr:phytoene/squalene synthase family protein [Candidatus Omnitrophota bacterium]
MKYVQEQLQDKINAGYKKAGLITKKHARTFYFTSHFLSKEQRYSTYAVYALCRISDDAVDIKEGAFTLEKLSQIKRDLQAVYNKKPLERDILLAFKETAERYAIPQVYFEELLEGVSMDLTQSRYRTFEDLYTYCYKVAGVVGLIMLKIFGYTDSRAKAYAVDLGVAMQLTNILRDIKEDFQRKRIYLPEEEMERFGVSEHDIANSRVNQNFISLIKFQVQRARQYYDNALKGIKFIRGLRARFVALAMKDIYGAILDSIEKNRYDVYSQRAYVRIKEKWVIILKTLLRGKYL